MRKESIMEHLEKVEKLRERANVTYEEAKAALEANNWDLLDAMVALEKAGKTESPKQERYSTSYDQQSEFIPVVKTVEEQKNDKPEFGKSIRNGLRRFWEICKENSFCCNYHGKNVFTIPMIGAVLILLFSWHVTIPVILISLAFGVRYSFEGKDDLKQANDFMENAGAAAESLKESLVNAASAAAEGKKEETEASAESAETAETVETAESAETQETSEEV